MAANVDAARLAMIIAILERRAGLSWEATTCTARSRAACGLRRPARTSASRSRSRSAFRDVALGSGTVAFGELGLSGEVRAVSQPGRRAAEATKLGFTRIVSPEGARDVGAAIALAFDASRMPRTLLVWSDVV